MRRGYLSPRRANHADGSVVGRRSRAAGSPGLRGTLRVPTLAGVAAVAALARVLAAVVAAELLALRHVAAAPLVLASHVRSPLTSLSPGGLPPKRGAGAVRTRGLRLPKRA